MTERNKRSERTAKRLSFSEMFSICASVVLLSLLIKDPDLIRSSVLESLKNCATFLIPSLFPLMTASEIVTECGAIEHLTHFLRKPISKLFGIEAKATQPYFLGLVGGYTTSVGSAISLYKKGSISKSDCERIIACSSLPSLAFLTSFVGSGILGNSTIGWVLWALCIISSIITTSAEQAISRVISKSKARAGTLAQGIFTRVFSESTLIKKPFSKIIVGAIAHSAQAMLIICACVVFFSTLIDALRSPFMALGISQEIQDVIFGSLELTNGVSSISNVSDPNLKLVFCGFFIGWSGLCVHFQIISLCDDTDISFKRYFIFKAIQAIVCGLLTLLVISI